MYNVVFAIILNALLTPDLGVELEEEEEDVDAVLLGVVHDDAAPAALDLADILYTGHGVRTHGGLNFRNPLLIMRGLIWIQSNSIYFKILKTLRSFDARVRTFCNASVTSYCTQPYSILKYFKKAYFIS